MNACRRILDNPKINMIYGINISSAVEVGRLRCNYIIREAEMLKLLIFDLSW